MSFALHLRYVGVSCCRKNHMPVSIRVGRRVHTWVADGTASKLGGGNQLLVQPCSGWYMLHAAWGICGAASCFPHSRPTTGTKLGADRCRFRESFQRESSPPPECVHIVGTSPSLFRQRTRRALHLPPMWRPTDPKF